MKAGVALGLMLAALPARADDRAAPLDRLREREAVLGRQSGEAAERARGQALLAYRLSRLRGARFFAAPERRAADAQALGATAEVLRRSLLEASTLEHERRRVTEERERLEQRLAGEPPASDPAEVPPGEHQAEGFRLSRLFRRPVRGTLLARPGVRRDPATNVDLRFDGAQILARLDDPVRSIAAAEVRRVSPLPQGGYAVLLAHEAGWVSLVAGLRDVRVAPGERIPAGATVGRVGRDLDGVPVLTFELWRHGRAQDPSPVLAESDRDDRRAHDARRASRRRR